MSKKLNTYVKKTLKESEEKVRFRADRSLIEKSALKRSVLLDRLKDA